MLFVDDCAYHAQPSPGSIIISGLPRSLEDLQTDILAMR